MLKELKSHPTPQSSARAAEKRMSLSRFTQNVTLHPENSGKGPQQKGDPAAGSGGLPI